MDVLPIVDRIRAIVADPDVVTDDTGAEPQTFDPNTVYVFPDGDSELVGAETGPPGRQNFDVLAVFMADDRGEEARRERTQDVTTVLLSRRDTWIDRLQQRESCDLWAHISVSSDEDYTSNFEGRAIAVRVQGYRYL